MRKLDIIKKDIAKSIDEAITQAFNNGVDSVIDIFNEKFLIKIWRKEAVMENPEPFYNEVMETLREVNSAIIRGRRKANGSC